MKIYVVIILDIVSDGVNAWTYQEYWDCRVFSTKEAAELYAAEYENCRIEERTIDE